MMILNLISRILWEEGFGDVFKAIEKKRGKFMQLKESLMILKIIK